MSNMSLYCASKRTSASASKFIGSRPTTGLLASGFVHAEPDLVITVTLSFAVLDTVAAIPGFGVGPRYKLLHVNIGRKTIDPSRLCRAGCSGPRPSLAD
jgi:hypothetical protein